MEKRTIAERFGTEVAIELEVLCKIKHHATVPELEDFIYDRVFPDGASLGEIDDFPWFEDETVLRDLGL